VDRDLRLSARDYDGLPPVTPSGDRALSVGDELIDAWTERAALTDPGELLDAPDFGGGVRGALLRLGSPSQMASLASQIKRTYLSDSRFADATVKIRLDPDTPARVVIDRDLVLAEGTMLSLRG
jgi:hypothetical protein